MAALTGILRRRRLLRPCPECGQTVVWPHNDVLLDWPAQPFHNTLYPWVLQRYRNVPLPNGRKATRIMAAHRTVPSSMRMPGETPMGHRAHEHQPPDSLLRKGGEPFWQLFAKAMEEGS